MVTVKREVPVFVSAADMAAMNTTERAKYRAEVTKMGDARKEWLDLVRREAQAQGGLVDNPFEVSDKPTQMDQYYQPRLQVEDTPSITLPTKQRTYSVSNRKEVETHNKHQDSSRSTAPSATTTTASPMRTITKDAQSMSRAAQQPRGGDVVQEFGAHLEEQFQIRNHEVQMQEYGHAHAFGLATGGAVSEQLDFLRSVYDGKSQGKPTVRYGRFEKSASPDRPSIDD